MGLATAALAEEEHMLVGSQEQLLAPARGVALWRWQARTKRRSPPGVSGRERQRL
jgi:hypothetical protein